jgi:uncharacterized protein (DUF2235 family)
MVLPQREATMGKTICIFSDGTGQAGGVNPINWTNVYRLFVAMRDADPDGQICFYDPGLGANPDDSKSLTVFEKAYNLVSKATGYGITRNIVDCYTALMHCCEPGDRVFLFGFSRGAYTVRSLGAVLGLCGIPPGLPKVRRWDGFESQLDGAARTIATEAVTKVYQVRDAKAREDAAAAFRDTHRTSAAPPYFVGVWDTVRALGVKGLSDLLPNRHYFNNDFLHKDVRYGRQALAIDENRKTFKPEIWDERGAPPDQIRQVWFSGVHSDIGGGYGLRMGLADLTLEWMIAEAMACEAPPAIDLAKLPQPLAPDALGNQHDERQTASFPPWQLGTREGFVGHGHFRETAATAPSVRIRFDADSAPVLGDPFPYRPVALRNHPDFRTGYS